MIDAPNVTIREAVVDDAPAIALAYVNAWHRAYKGLVPDAHLATITVDDRTSRFEDRLQTLSPRVRFWVAVRDGQVIGFCDNGPSTESDAEPTTGTIFGLYLDPSAWDQGIGRALFERALDDLREQGFTDATLWCMPTNERARRFYEKAGWRADGKTIQVVRAGQGMLDVRYRVTL